MVIPTDEPAAEAEPEAQEEDSPAPDAAGGVTQSKDEIPTYYAWKPFGGKTESEYDAKYLGVQSPEKVEHAHEYKSLSTTIQL